MGLLNLQPQQLGEGDRQSNDSTDAIKNQGNGGDDWGNNSGDGLGLGDEDNNAATCPGCGVVNSSGAFNCEACGTWVQNN
jgi:hypothetical protein